MGRASATFRGSREGRCSFALSNNSTVFTQSEGWCASCTPISSVLHSFMQVHVFRWYIPLTEGLLLTFFIVWVCSWRIISVCICVCVWKYPHLILIAERYLAGFGFMLHFSYFGTLKLLIHCFLISICFPWVFCCHILSFVPQADLYLVAFLTFSLSITVISLIVT